VQWRSPLFQLKIVILLLIILTGVGVTFYCTYLGWSFREALLQIVETVTTLGGSVRHPKTTQLVITQWFEIFFIITILLVVLWGVTLLVEATVKGELLYYWGTRRMEQRIGSLNKHYIICGFGRMGQEIARQLARSRRHFVVVEHNKEQIPNLENEGYLFVEGDAREDEQLLRAGIKKAKGLIAVYASDEENVYITLSARVLNPKLFIVTRSSHANSEAKMLRAGADRVFSPYVIGGRRMAEAVLRPTVLEFLDTIIHGEQMEMVLEEVRVTDTTRVCGKCLAGDHDVESIGVHMLGVHTHDGRMLMRDLGSYTVQAGDTLILLGEPSQMRAALKRLTGSENPPTAELLPVAEG
jgi:voltage-gated potassium channel